MEVYLWQLLSLMRECESIDVYVNDKRIFHGQVFEYEVADCESKAVVIDFVVKTESSNVSIVRINCR